jgi:hypothetical protein
VKPAGQLIVRTRNWPQSLAMSRPKNARHVLIGNVKLQVRWYGKHYCKIRNERLRARRNGQ